MHRMPLSIATFATLTALPFSAWADTQPDRPVPPATIPTLHQADLGPGDCLTHPSVGNPISPGLYNKYETAIDVPPTAASALMWSRHYNSGIVADGDVLRPTDTMLGSRWRGHYDR